jgi:HlyD family secretion protein
MRRFLFWTVVVGIVAGAGAVGYCSLRAKQPLAKTYRMAAVRRGEVTEVVKSSGAVQPVQSVQVGSFVSGPIVHLYVDFNAEVKKGQLLAQIDELIPKANLAQAKAALLCAKANLLQADAKLEQARRDWKRAEDLMPKQAIAVSDYDQYKSAYETAKANVEVARATIDQCQGAVELAQTNLDYTKIFSPVDGIVTDRKVDPGQTLASTYQTPVLFVVAPDLRKRVYVLASVDEADIGMIRDAQTRKQPARFTVDAYPKDHFEGKIWQIRLTPTTTQNVVTYTVVVEAANAELKLLPGMTANLSFQITARKGVLRIPNAALRFFPKKPGDVRPGDRRLVEDKPPEGEENADAEDASAHPSGGDPSAKEHHPKKRYVWIAEGEALAAVEVETGLSDDVATELVSGDLKDGQLLVTGVRTP